MPLLAVKDECVNQGLNARFFWIGTKSGPEKEIIKAETIPFYAIPTVKLRRYWSFENIKDIFKLSAVFLHCALLIRKIKPDLIISAGAFSGVPVIWAGSLFGAKSIIHQQDVLLSLSNKLTSRFADAITVTFEKSLDDFSREKTFWIGNPVQKDRTSGDILKGYEMFGLKESVPVVLVLGGGTGSYMLNKLIKEALPSFKRFCQVIHVTGGRGVQRASENYFTADFLNREQIKHAYAVSDLVISRAGLSTLTELSYLAKPAILVPMPVSHQEQNAEVFKNGHAAIVTDQKKLTAEELSKIVKELLENSEKRMILSAHIKRIMKENANAAFVDVIRQVMNIQNIKAHSF